MSPTAVPDPTTNPSDFRTACTLEAWIRTDQLGGRTGQLGGQINHPELRPGYVVPPVTEDEED
jgi:hypothetical protein